MDGWIDEETDGRKEGGRQADATHKVLSLGMWLKLATDRRLMLLLLRVLRGSERNTVRSGNGRVSCFLPTGDASPGRDNIVAPRAVANEPTRLKPSRWR